MAWARISRSTVQCATARPLRRSAAVILGRPYLDSGVGFPSASVRRPSIACTTTASVTVRAASTRFGAFQARYVLAATATPCSRRTWQIV